MVHKPNKNPVNTLSTHSKVDIMSKEITVKLQFDELREVTKSVSIGCDQVSRKLDRLTVGLSPKKLVKETQDELLLLMQANAKLSDALISAVENSF